MSNPPDWQLPAGVSRGLWNYFQSDQVAADYDARLAGSGLFRQDEAFVHDICAKPGRLIDLGCGTGRMLRSCSRRGHRVVGVDFSEAMLARARENVGNEGPRVDLLKVNLVDMHCLADRSFDYAICLFSTLGMISGTGPRRAVLNEANRLLAPGGKLVLHVHNWWFNIRDWTGRRWLLSDWSRRVRELPNAGDRPMPIHEGIAGLCLHHFTRREILRLLKETGFHKLAVRPVGLEADGRLRFPWIFPSLRAYGFLLAAERK